MKNVKTGTKVYNVGDGDVVLAVGEEQAGGVVDDVPETPSHHSLVLARSCEGRQGYCESPGLARGWALHLAAGTESSQLHTVPLQWWSCGAQLGQTLLTRPGLLLLSSPGGRRCQY